MRSALLSHFERMTSFLYTRPFPLYMAFVFKSKWLPIDIDLLIAMIHRVRDIGCRLARAAMARNHAMLETREHGLKSNDPMN